MPAAFPDISQTVVLAVGSSSIPPLLFCTKLRQVFHTIDLAGVYQMCHKLSVLSLLFNYRMEHLGIKVKSMTEEEYCLIPMGGVLPTFPQRTLGIGGTGGMVHPSTGWLHLLLKPVCCWHGMSSTQTKGAHGCDQLNHTKGCCCWPLALQ